MKSNYENGEWKAGKMLAQQLKKISGNYLVVTKMEQKCQRAPLEIRQVALPFAPPCITTTEPIYHYINNVVASLLLHRIIISPYG